MNSNKQQLTISVDRLGGSPPDIVYHYTDGGGLLGILQNHQLWASASHVLNDEEEIEYGLNVLRAAINELRIDDVLPTEITDRWNTIADSTVFAESLQGCFILSASTDDDSLSQWRNYAGNDGFCIGLNSELLYPDRAADFQGAKTFPGLTTPGWLPVIYNPVEQLRIAKDVLLKSSRNEMDALWNIVLEQIPTLAKNLEITKSLEDGFDLMRLQRLVACFKHPAFIDEREIRFVVSLRDSPRVYYRQASGRLVPYVALHSNNRQQPSQPRLPIASVRSAPTVRNETTLVVTEMLRSFGYEDVKVDKSSIPFRS